MKMKKTKKKKLLLVLVTVVIIAALCVGGFTIYGNNQMKKIPGLTFTEALNVTLKDNKNAVITVGVIQDGLSSFTVYGKDGAELPHEEHIYEIGSLTKTFTAALIEKCIEQGKISLDDTVDRYLDLPSENTYPTIRQLVTHTSGYKPFYFDSPMIGNFLHRRNAFYGISDEMIQNRLSKLSTKDDTYAFNYSNFGFSVLGLILESVYGEDYTTLVNRFVKDELGLKNTQISDGSGDLDNYWDWKEGDAYLSAGGLTSSISDMLAYAQMQLSDEGLFAACHKSIAAINVSNDSCEKMGIRLNGIGMSWIIDDADGIIWHNGGTGNYNCYLGFQPETGTAVVILSNLSPSDRIPATVLGVKLMKELGE